MKAELDTNSSTAAWRVNVETFNCCNRNCSGAWRIPNGIWGPSFEPNDVWFSKRHSSRGLLQVPFTPDRAVNSAPTLCQPCEGLYPKNVGGSWATAVTKKTAVLPFMVQSSCATIPVLFWATFRTKESHHSLNNNVQNKRTSVRNGNNFE